MPFFFKIQGNLFPNFIVLPQILFFWLLWIGPILYFIYNIRVLVLICFLQIAICFIYLEAIVVVVYCSSSVLIVHVIVFSAEFRMWKLTCCSVNKLRYMEACIVLFHTNAFVHIEVYINREWLHSIELHGILCAFAVLLEHVLIYIELCVHLFGFGLWTFHAGLFYWNPRAIHPWTRKPDGESNFSWK